MPDGERHTSPGLRWSLAGIFATIALGAPALYFTVQEGTPSLKFEITSEANVFDLHESLENLDIIFQGENIRKANQNLRIVTLTVRNDGRATILQNHFDTTEPWGFTVKDAQLVDAPRVVDSNSAYLRNKLQPSVPANNVVEFQKVIIEPGKFISLELLLLHGTSVTPALVPIGKIAGIDELTVTRRPPEHAALTFWGTGFGRLDLGPSVPIGSLRNDDYHSNPSDYRHGATLGCPALAATAFRAR